MSARTSRSNLSALLLSVASCSPILDPSDSEEAGAGGASQGPASGGNGSGGSASGGARGGSGGALPSGGVGPQDGGLLSSGGAGSGGSVGGTGGLRAGIGGSSSPGGGAPGSGGAQPTGGQNGSGGAEGGPYKFMALGDSITGATCYAQYLAKEFSDAGHPNVVFVGGVTNNQACSGAGNTKSEGHGGYLVTYLTTNNPPQSGKGNLSELQTWTQEKPDIVLIHFGTNDVWNNIPASQILEAESFVVEEFRKQNPNTLFFVSKIIPMNPSGCAECKNRVTALNAAITSEWADALARPTSSVRIIDQWTGFSTEQDTGDGVHPNPGGGQKMATRAFEAISAALK